MDGKSGKLVSSYKGGWAAGFRHGQGINRYACGRVYVGEFEAGQREGQGTLTLPDGCTESGPWIGGNLPFGELKCGPGDAGYIGFLSDGVPDGLGEATYRNGHVYSGRFKDGKRHGLGIYTWTDQSFYKGIWVNGSRKKFINKILEIATRCHF